MWDIIRAIQDELSARGIEEANYTMLCGVVIDGTCVTIAANEWAHIATPDHRRALIRQRLDDLQTALSLTK